MAVHERPEKARDVTWLNGADDEDVVGLLRDCVSADAWVHRVFAGRPYANLDAVLAQSDAAISDLSMSDMLEAMARHPRIGETAHIGGSEGVLLEREQAAVGRPSDDTSKRLHEANESYEKRFGFMYLVSAVGLDASAILADLGERMSNTPEVEFFVAREELGKIAKSRLAMCVGGG